MSEDLKSIDFDEIISKLSEPIQAIKESIDNAEGVIADMSSALSTYKAGFATGGAAIASFGKPLDTALLAGSVFAAGVMNPATAPIAFAGFLVGEVIGAILGQVFASADRKTDIEIWYMGRDLMRNSPIVLQDKASFGARRAYAGHSSFQDWLAWHRRWCAASQKREASAYTPSSGQWQQQGTPGQTSYRWSPEAGDPVLKELQYLGSGDWMALRTFLKSQKVERLGKDIIRYKADGTEIQSGCWPNGVRCLHPNVAKAHPKRFGYPKVATAWGVDMAFLCAAISIYDDNKPPLYMGADGIRRVQLAYDIYATKTRADATMLYEEVSKRADAGDAGAWGALPGLEQDLHVRFIDEKIYLNDGDFFGTPKAIGRRIGDIPYWVPLSKSTPKIAQSQLYRAWTEHGLSALRDDHLRDISARHPNDGVGHRSQSLSEFSDEDAEKVLANATVIAIATTRGNPKLFDRVMAPIRAELERRGIKEKSAPFTRSLSHAWKRLIKTDVIEWTQMQAARAQEKSRAQARSFLSWGLALVAAGLGIRSWRLR